jgi:hypothetical protein
MARASAIGPLAGRTGNARQQRSHNVCNNPWFHVFAVGILGMLLGIIIWPARARDAGGKKRGAGSGGPEAEGASEKREFRRGRLWSTKIESNWRGIIIFGKDSQTAGNLSCGLIGISHQLLDNCSIA